MIPNEQVGKRTNTGRRGNIMLYKNGPKMLCKLELYSWFSHDVTATILCP